jgi:signal transduction histidine kinase
MPAAVAKEYAFMGATTTPNFLTYFTYLVLAASAIMFLPRQFHASVVENSNEKHILTAMWMFPLYLFLINLFVLPIAGGGLLLGNPANTADTFVLALPLKNGAAWLTSLVFLGGFAAGTGMVIVETMSIASMVSNYWLVPLMSKHESLRGLNRHVLKFRWVVAFLFITVSYFYQRAVGDSYPLVAMGMISFAAVLQFAPSFIAGLFWKDANRKGAIAGLSAGFAMWCYTLLIPTFVKGGFLPKELLSEGLFGLSWLRPEALFGLAGVDNLTHALFWTMVSNVGLLVTVSLASKQSESEKEIAEEFITALDRKKDATGGAIAGGERNIELRHKEEIAKAVLGQFFPPHEAEKMFGKCLAAVKCDTEEAINILHLSELHKELERTLAGSIGTAAADQIMKKSGLISASEQESLSRFYSDMLASLKISPRELTEKINYHQERAALIQKQADELAEINRGLERQVADRTKEVREQMHRVKMLLDNMQQAVFAVSGTMVVIPPVSRFTEQVFGKDLTGLPVLDTVFAAVDHSSEAFAKLSTVLSMVYGEDKLQWDMIAEQLPAVLKYKKAGFDSDRLLRLNYQPLLSEKETVDAILFEVEDITEMVRLETEARDKQRSMERLHELAELRLEQLAGAFENLHRLLGECRVIVDRSAKSPDDLPAFKRHLHTLKGNARAYGFFMLSREFHELETSLHAVLGARGTASSSLASLSETVSSVSASIAAYEDVASRYLSYRPAGGSAGAAGRTFDVDADRFEDIVSRAERLAEARRDEAIAELAGHIARLRYVPIKAALGNFKAMVSDLCASLSKEANFELTGEEIFLPTETLSELQDALTHLVRNAMDHGLEVPVLRKGAGKAEAGSIRLRVSSEGEEAVLVLEDDGQGIDVERVSQKVVELGLKTPEQIKSLSREKLVELIFLPGLSTREKVSEISGRGIGMDVLMDFVKHHKGGVKVSTTKGKGTRFEVRFQVRGDSRFKLTQNSCAYSLIISTTV